MKKLAIVLATVILTGATVLVGIEGKIVTPDPTPIETTAEETDGILGGLGIPDGDHE